VRGEWGLRDGIWLGHGQGLVMEGWVGWIRVQIMTGVVLYYMKKERIGKGQGRMEGMND